MSLIVQNELQDSTIWNEVKPRNNDIIVASCYRSGTTLTQQIINLLINGHSNYINLENVSPWVELIDGITREKSIKKVEKLPSPRILKTHLPFESLPDRADWKYIYLVRDGRDVGLSFYNTFINRYNCDSEAKEAEQKVSENFLDFWDRWIETGEPYWPFWEHLQSWLKVRDLPNLLLVHYANLTKNKPQEVLRIANFLNLKIDSDKMEVILHQSSLEYMKKNWQKFQPSNFKAKTFLGKGETGGWKKVLTPERVINYENLAVQKLGNEFASWMQNGGELPPL